MNKTYPEPWGLPVQQGRKLRNDTINKPVGEFSD